MVLSRAGAGAVFTRACVAAAYVIAANAAYGRQLPSAELVYRVEYQAPEGGPASLMQAADGNFFGTTADSYYGGPGALFRMRADGLFTVIHRFTGGLDGGDPSGRLLQASDGRIYGMTSKGGRHDRGIIFRVAPGGQLTTLHHFSGPDGANPSGELIQSNDGDLYGVTAGGGAGNNGTAFRMGLDGSVRTIRHFTKGKEFEPDHPVLGLVEHGGAFYGILAATGWSARVYRMSRDGAAVASVYDISLFDGDYSMIGLNGLPIKASDGNLYGTTQNSCKGAKGALYRITPNGAVRELREFASCAPAPKGQLLEARDGSFVVPGSAQLLRLTRAGELTILGESPGRSLVQTPGADLYGVGTSGISRVSLAMAPLVRVSGRFPTRLTWTPIFGASSYTVKRTAANGEEVVLGRVSATSFEDRTAVAGQRYFYSISSMTGYGESAFSQPSSSLAGHPQTYDVDADGRADVTSYDSQYGGWWVQYSTGLPQTNLTWGGVAGDLPVPADFNGDGMMDLTIFRPSNGTWYIHGVENVVWGQRGDLPVPADYDGDGRADVAVYRRTTGTWYVRGRAPIIWGEPNDIPVPADFNGDGITDIAVYRPATGVWFVRGIKTVTYGVVGDLPMPADYDGDGSADVAVFRRTNRTWYVKDQLAAQWGEPGDVPVILDRDGDGRVELGAYRALTGTFYFSNLATHSAERVKTLGSYFKFVPIGRGIAQQQRVAVRADADFDNDGKDDVMVYRPSTKTWFMRHSFGVGHEELLWFPDGARPELSRPLSGDFDGNGTLDVVDFRPAAGYWVPQGAAVALWGLPGDLPVPGDYNGDGSTDIALFRPSNGTWYIYGIANHVFGSPGDVPVPADYDGDGVADLAVYRDGVWHVRGGASVRYGESSTGDIPIPADYDGDGVTDFAVFRPTTGTWYVRGQLAIQFGSQGDLPVPLDRDGDGRAELNVYRPSTGTWYFHNPATGATESFVWGVPGDIPAGRIHPWFYQVSQNAAAWSASLSQSPGPTVAASGTGSPASARTDGTALQSGEGVPGSNPIAAASIGQAASATAGARRFHGHDFDGDGRADVMVYRPRTGDWWMRRSDGTSHTRMFWGGTTGDVAAPGDYNGDGVMDPTIFRPSSANWHIYGLGSVTWGRFGDLPVPADYNGDGVTDIAVYRPSTGHWYVRGVGTFTWGEPGDLPVPADYDGDGIAEIAVFRPATGVWFIRGLMNVTYGILADMPAPADYDGNGTADIAVFRPSSGTWFVKDQFATVWGQQGDIPVPLDRNGDGRVELGVYRRGTGVWYFKDGPTGSIDSVGWGERGDVPIGRGMFPWNRAFGRFDRDLDRDGRDDIVIFQPFTGMWSIRHSNGAADELAQWGRGGATDLPVPGDYTGDGLTDLAVYEQFSGNWVIRGVGIIQWGLPGDVPVPGDYDGDGLTDIAVFRPSNGMWYVRGLFNYFNSSRGFAVRPVPADYNGDGITDTAYWDFGYLSASPYPLTPRGSCFAPAPPADYDGNGQADFVQYVCDAGIWQFPNDLDIYWGTPAPFASGLASDLPVPLDRDGDGRSELGVYRAATGIWRFKNLRTGATETIIWGGHGAIPIGTDLSPRVVRPR